MKTRGFNDSRKTKKISFGLDNWRLPFWPGGFALAPGIPITPHRRQPYYVARAVDRYITTIIIATKPVQNNWNIIRHARMSGH